MKIADRNKALYLRTHKQLGYGQIAKQLSVSKSTLSRWLRDLPLSEKRILELRREGWSRGEAKRETFRKTMRTKRDAKEQNDYLRIRKRFRKISNQALFVAGLMLYLAEGDKKDRYRIGLANTDSEVIKFFLWWVQRFLGVEKTSVKIQLHLYESMNLKAEENFWIQETRLERHQFYKNQIRPLRPASFSYPESFRHGTCKMYVYGLKPTTELMLSIKAFLDTYSESRA